MNRNNRLKELTALVKTMDKSCTRIARLVTLARDTMQTKEWLDLIEKSGLGARKAYHLMTIWRQVQELSLSETKVNAIGWSKMLELLPYLTADNKNTLLDIAQGKSKYGPVTITKLRYLVQSDVPELHSELRYMILSMTQRQAKIIDNALIRFGAKRSRRGRGLSKRAEALVTLIETVGAKKACQ